MKRWRVLVAKEAAQHWKAVLGTSLLLWFGYYCCLLLEQRNPDHVTYLRVPVVFLEWLLPLGALVLSNRLVVGEYQASTQMFLEALPLRRQELAMLKYIIGLLLLGTAAADAVMAAASSSSATEPVTQRFLCILLARAEGYVFCLWGYFFLMGFMGRFRVTLYLTSALVPLMLQGTTSFEMKHFGPIALMNSATFPFERLHFPVAELQQSLILGTALLTLALAMSAWREGSLAEELSRPMSQKEKALVAILMFGLVFLGMVLDKKREKAPYEFPRRATVRSRRAPIQILYFGEGARADAEALLRGLERDTVDLQQTLGWAELPVMRVALWEGLDSNVFELAQLKDKDGILVRANFRRRDKWDQAEFRAYMLHWVINRKMEGRGTFDPKHWLLDGFAQWWAQRGQDGRRLWLRALWATRKHSPTERDMAEWARYSEELGEPMSGAVAYSALRVLAERKGEDAVLALARAVLARRPPLDAREYVYERFHSMSKVFRGATGLEWSEFLQDWEQSLRRGRKEAHDLMERLPEGVGRVDVGNEIRGHFQMQRDVAVGTVCSLVHMPIGAWDQEIDDHDLRREEHPWSGGRTAEFALNQQYDAGQRLFVALEVESRELGCPLRLFATRAEVP